MIELNNGVLMPKVGLGVFQITDLEECERIVKQAFEIGYRMIDTAAAYQNEVAVGRAIKASHVKRADIFITSKLWVSEFSYEKAKAGIEESLQKLGTDYLDLYLLHQPFGDVIGAWRALEEAYRAGKIRAIGVSNFHEDQVKNLELTTAIKPAINQIEINPWHQQTPAVNFLQQEHIQAQAWAPFAEGKHHIFENKILQEIGNRHHKTVSQVILRWLLQRNIIVIPKSVDQEHLKENIDIFDFVLTDQDMTTISKLDTKETQFFDSRDPVAIEQIFGSSLAELKI